MLMYEAHYTRRGEKVFSYVYGYNKQEAEEKARKTWKTFYKLVFVGIR